MNPFPSPRAATHSLWHDVKGVSTLDSELADRPVCFAHLSRDRLALDNPALLVDVEVEAVLQVSQEFSERDVRRVVKCP